MIYNFDENEMPYGILERFGLTQEMIEDLPTDILQNILNGRHSPVLPVHIIADDGEEVKARTRFCLVRTPESNVDVLFFPKLDEYDLKVFNEQQKQNLLNGGCADGYFRFLRFHILKGGIALGGDFGGFGRAVACQSAVGGYCIVSGSLCLSLCLS